MHVLSTNTNRWVVRGDNGESQSINKQIVFHTLIIKYNIFKKNYVGKGKVEVKYL